MAWQQLRNRLVRRASTRNEPAWDEAERRRAADIGLGDVDPGVLAIIERTRPYTLTSPDRIAALCAAVDYVVASRMPGAVVECGVWRGGSLMAVALRLMALDRADRNLFAFDTFVGMSQPSTFDVDFAGQPWEHWIPPGVAEAGASLDDVQRTLRSTGYPGERLHFIPGDVTDTLPTQAPDKIALLRLDTDWYESTRTELTHLYPRLVVGGILIIDDYGHYLGARKAVDDYLREHRIFLHRIDYTGRIAVKQHA